MDGDLGQVLKQKGVYDPQRLFGVTTLDVVRARTFIAAAAGNDVNKTTVPVIGGHAGTTIVPLLSQAEPAVKFTDEQRDALTHRIMFGGDEVVKAKAGGGSATLSMAYAGAEFADSVMSALDGKKGVTECTFVESTVTDAKFFSSPVTLGKDGVDTIHGYGTVNAYEQVCVRARARVSLCALLLVSLEASCASTCQAPHSSRPTNRALSTPCSPTSSLRLTRASPGPRRTRPR